jgi:predicted DNA binding CopG/RHH family protein
MINDEIELLNDLENGICESNDLSASESKRYSEYAKHTKELRQKKQTTIRFSVSDLIVIKAKAKKSNIGYQNLIQALVHNYAIGKIDLKL